MDKVFRVGASVLLFTLIFSCSVRSNSTLTSNPFYPSSKPGVRWWWFATDIQKEDVKYQLDWAKENNFGTVEIAWVYPLHRYAKLYASTHNRHYPVDSSAPKWLSTEWVEAVSFTKKYADSIGLTCDFTFGSAWPSAGSNIDSAHSVKVYGNPNFRQKVSFSWSWPEEPLVIDHLDSNAFHKFAQPILQALQPALKGSRSALFTDSWEIKMNSKLKIWTTGFDTLFRQEFGYDIIPFMEAGLDSFPDVRYDYMLLLDKLVRTGFYEPYARTCTENGAFSRVQCLASPTDILTTYSLVDIPETEAMLNDPNFSRIVSSSATLAQKQVVSSETFTCMYGFPSTYLRQEQSADLKLVVDALFAQGVNQHFYHGMPYNPKGSDSIEFFATTYIGPGSSLSPELPDFNKYVEKVSGILQKGKNYSDVAVYIPFEDAVMQGAYPPELQRVWVWGAYEMRYIDPPSETMGYHPLWINRHFLDLAVFKDGKLQVGDARFSLLYVDVNYLDIRSLDRILELAQMGLPVCLKRIPKQPGKQRSAEFSELLSHLQKLPNVSGDFSTLIDHPPLIGGDSIPAYWCRQEADGTLYLFLAQPKARDLGYPLYSGMSHMKASVIRDLTFNYNGHSLEQPIEFKPYQSLLLRIDPKGKLQFLDIEYSPSEPLVRPKEPQKSFF
ncbi:MAG: hypothetical protein H6606_00915 [Flavobacteriales bacterium]|nr:hypothetical protein [Flavobacteriales bacterium]